MMNTSNTGLLQRNISRVFPNKWVQIAIEVAFLFGMGALAVLLHAKLRIPLQIPGRQGLVFMAIVIFARGFSKYPLASTISLIGSSATMLSFSTNLHDPFSPFIYLLLGMVLDMAFLLLARDRQTVLWTGIASAIAWTMIPLSRLVIFLFTGFFFSSFRSGFLLSHITHLLFGMMGGILGYSLFKLISPRSDRQ